MKGTRGSFFRIEMGMLSHPGMKREHNEDSMDCHEPCIALDLLSKGCVYVVADGVATRQAGEVASRYAARRIVERYYQSPTLDTGKSLSESIELVNNELAQKANEEEGEKGMSTTLLAGVVKGEKLFLANVGDCRGYLIRDQQIEKITKDHSFTAELVDIGRISDQEAAKHPQRSVITRYLGAEQLVEPDIFERDIQTADTVVLCTDGLWSQVTKDEIREIASGEDPSQAVSTLIDKANERGGPDNVTAIVLRVGKPVPVDQRLEPVILGKTE